MVPAPVKTPEGVIYEVGALANLMLATMQAS